MILSGVFDVWFSSRLCCFWMASSLRSLGGAIALMIGSHCLGVDFSVPEIIRMVLFR